MTNMLNKCFSRPSFGKLTNSALCHLGSECSDNTHKSQFCISLPIQGYFQRVQDLSKRFFWVGQKKSCTDISAGGLVLSSSDKNKNCYVVNWALGFRTSGLLLCLALPKSQNIMINRSLLSCRNLTDGKDDSLTPTSVN